MTPTSSGVRDLIGAGDRIAAVTLPVALVGIALNLVYPSAFAVGGPSQVLRTASIVLLSMGVVVWAWSVILIVTVARRGGLITTGPFAVVRHPLYTGVSLLVLPWLGFLLDTWVGVPIGAVLYLSSRRYARSEDAALADRFGPAYEAYRDRVLIPWL